MAEKERELTALSVFLRLCHGLICNHIAEKERDDCSKIVCLDDGMG